MNTHRFLKSTCRSQATRALLALTLCLALKLLPMAGNLRSALAADGTLSLAPSQDTWLANPGLSPPALNYGACDTLTVDRSGGGLGNGHPLIQFDLSGVPIGATITSAQLVLTKLGGTTLTGSPFAVNAYRLTNPWEEGAGGCAGAVGTANWSQRQASVNWTTAGGDYNATILDTVSIADITGVYTWTVTSTVQDWLSGAQPNYGFLLGSPDLGTTTHIFGTREQASADNRPRLVINYTGGVPGAYLDRFTTVASYAGSDGSANWSASPWVETDDGGQGATAGNIQVGSNAACQSGSCLLLKNSRVGDNIYRQANLSALTTATLSYDYNVTNLDGQVDVQISGDGGGAWTTLRSYGKNYTPATGSESFDISLFNAANTRVRFWVSGANSKTMYVDNVEIRSGRCGSVSSSATAIDSSTQTTNPANALGAPDGAVTTLNVFANPPNNGYIVLDLGSTLAAGTTVTIRMKEFHSIGVDSALADVDASPSLFSIFSGLTTYTPTASLDDYAFIIPAGDARYLQIRARAFSGDPLVQNIDIDALSFTVAEVAGAVDAVDDTLRTAQDLPAAFSVLANDSGQCLVASVLASPAHGSAVVNLGQAVTYTPTAGYSGPDAFTYHVENGGGGADTALVTIVVDPPGNSLPNAVDDTLRVAQDTPAALNVLANDNDGDGDALSVSMVTPPVHGSAAVDPNGSIIYTPTASYSGLDTLTYQVADGAGGTDAALVTIVVDPPGNSPPDAVDDTVRVLQNTPATIAVLANDGDSDGDALSVSIIRPPVHGAAVANLNGSIVYTPTAGYSGLDAITYQANDGAGGTDTALVTIVVDPPGNSPPNAVDDVVTVVQNSSAVVHVLTNDSDSDGDALRVTLALPPGHGAASVNPDGSVVYTSTAGYAGPDTLLYRLDDGQGGADLAVVSITVDPAANNAPNAADDTAITKQDRSVTISVLVNDRDDDGDPLRLTVTTLPGHGSVITNPDGSITYTPNAGYDGTDFIVYRLEDGRGGQDWALVSIYVAALTNNAPLANNDRATLTQNRPATLYVLKNDLELDGDPLLVTVTTVPAHGTTLVNPDGTIVYTPTLDYTGLDSLVYRIDDGNGTSASATVQLIIEPPFYNCSQIGDISRNECEALVSLYRATDGPHWLNRGNWLESNMACTWAGVTCRDEGNGLFSIIVVELSNNQVQGELPCEELSTIPLLEVLDLGGNQLQGGLVCDIGFLSELRQLDLHDNQLSGTLPPELGNLAKLETLALGGNQISGEIPETLGDLSNLQTLDLGGNQISGEIPESLGDLSNLTSLDLGQNQLTGEIPSSFVGLTSLTKLDIGHNAVTAGDAALLSFLNALQAGWQQTQNVGATNLQAAAQVGPLFALSWSPIAYVSDGGYYEISYATAPTGPFIVAGQTANKSANNYVVSDLSYDVTYYFRLRTFTPANAVNPNDVWSDYTSIVSAMMSTPTPPPPPAPTPIPTPTPIPAPYDLSVQRVEFSQVIQTTANDVPLVAGKPLMARLTVGVSGSATDITGITAQLRAFRNGVEVAGSPLNPFNAGGTITAKLTPSRSVISDTLNFIFPAAWTAAGDLTITATVNPGKADQNNSNNILTSQITLRAMTPLQIVIVPVAFQPGGTGTIYRPALNASTNYGLGFLADLYPVAEVKYTIHSELLFTGDLYTVDGWRTLLQTVRLMRNNELGNPSAALPKYYAVVRVGPGCCLPKPWPVSPASPFGGLGDTPGPISSGLEASSYWLDRDGNGLPDSPIPLVNIETHMAAHELGHTFGLGHTPCNITGDPNFPQPDGSIGDVGVYIPELRLLASNYKDVMSYCVDTRSKPTMWISAYNYHKLFNALAAIPLPGASPSLALAAAAAADSVMAVDATLAGAALQPAQTGWLLTGEIISTTTALSGTIEGAQTITSSAIVSDAATCMPYTIRLLDDAGRELFAYDFMPDAQNGDEDSVTPPIPPEGGGATSGTHDDSRYVYSFVVPKLAEATRIQLWHGADFLDELMVASLEPKLTASFMPSAASFTIAWSANDPNDTEPPTVLIRYSADGGQNWKVISANEPADGQRAVDSSQLGVSDNGLIEVIANNSSEPVTMRLELGPIVNKAPDVVILGDSVRTLAEGQSLVLAGGATDFEDGPLPSDRFIWSSQTGATLGVGGALVLAEGLSGGVYTITLAAADNNGAIGQSQVQVIVISDDSDNDSVDNSIEAAAPNGGDGNGDGIADDVQPEVASLPLHDGSGYVTVAASGDCTTLRNLRSLAETDILAQDTYYEFPYGLLDLTLRCSAPGGSAAVITYWHTASSQTGDRYRKLGPVTPGGATSVWYDYPAAFGTALISNTLVPTLQFTLTDGQMGDATGADGMIYDPGGPAFSPIDITKTLLTINPVRVGEAVNFAIYITNTGSVPIANLPLSDTYNIRYLQYVNATLTPDVINDTTPPGRLDWNDVTGSGDLAAGASLALTVTFTAVRDTTLLSNGATINTAQSDVFTATASVHIQTSTAAEMMEKQVNLIGDQVMVQWTTVDESRITGFLLWREDANGALAKLTEQPIVAQFAGQTVGANYSYADTSASSGDWYRYVIEMMNVEGESSYSEIRRIGANLRILLPIINR